jgi:hypothetical protein
MTSAWRRHHADGTATADGDASRFRRRLLDGLAASIVEKG